MIILTIMFLGTLAFLLGCACICAKQRWIILNDIGATEDASYKKVLKKRAKDHQGAMIFFVVMSSLSTQGLMWSINLWM